ncbi:MAG: AEC family transporter [Lachnospiraceae bacterium]|nr:AEC family transporter [Lachnospiraceae bacterium]
MTIVTTMCKLLIAMVIGFYLFRKRVLNREVNAKLSAMIVQITCPCIILNSISTVSHDDPQMVLKLFLAGVVMYAIYPLLARLLTKIMRVPAHLRGTYMCMFIFSNNIFMGYPVVQALFGDSAIFYITIFNMPFNILFFTLALHYFRKDAAIEANNLEKGKMDLRNAINNGIIASVAALVIYFANLSLPDIFYECVGFIGNITTPLSMIIIGSSMAAASLKDIKTEKGIWPMLPVRLGVMPLLVWAFMHLWTSDPTIISICTIGAGMPVASLVAMGSAPYPRQNKAASIGVVVSTLCSLVTIPIMAVLLGAN